MDNAFPAAPKDFIPVKEPAPLKTPPPILPTVDPSPPTPPARWEAIIPGLEKAKEVLVKLETFPVVAISYNQLPAEIAPAEPIIDLRLPAPKAPVISLILPPFCK